MEDQFLEMTARTGLIINSLCEQSEVEGIVFYG